MGCFEAELGHPFFEFMGRANLHDVPPAVLIGDMSDQVDGSSAFVRDVLQRDTADPRIAS